MTADFGPSIRRALSAPCRYDFLKGHSRMTGRDSFVRLSSIVAILKTGEAFNCSTLSRITGLSTKTISRDINFLRRQGVRIAYAKEFHTYRLNRECSLPPQFDFVNSTTRKGSQ